MIRTFLLEASRKRAERIAAALNQYDDIELIGSMSQPSTLLANPEGCDVVLVSAQVPLETWRDVARQRKVIVLDVADSPAKIAACLEAGAVGVLTNTNQVEELANTIRAAHNGELNVSPVVGSLLVERMRQLVDLSKQKRLERTIDPQSKTQLTERERTVLTLIGQGLSNQQIAKTLTIEQGTVKNHVHSILKKLNISSREQAAQFYALTMESMDNR